MSNYFKNFDGAETSDINLDTIQDFVNAEGMSGGLVRNEGQHRESFKMQSGMALLDAENYQMVRFCLKILARVAEVFRHPPFLQARARPIPWPCVLTHPFARRYPNLCRITTEQYGTTNRQRGQGLSRFAEGLQRGLGILNQNQNPNLQQECIWTGLWRK